MTELVSKSPEETQKIGRDLAKTLKEGDVVGFHGELGAGKTFIIKAICQSLGVNDVVNSPTFTLMQFYEGRKKILHMDCYRLKSVEEAEMLGIEEYFDSDHICLIEWAEKINELLPERTKRIEMEHASGHADWRTIKL